MRFHVLVGILLIAASLAGADLAWTQGPPIHRYTCLTKLMDTEKWLLEGMRTVDSEGILMQNRQYHPLGIAFYGIMRYEDFLASGDSAHYEAVCNQYKYFCDTTRTILVDSGRGLVLPYRTLFKDMPLPWHSGMSQGAALSFLTRYYALTGDASALPKMQQIAHVLMKPVALGGTLGQTPEGYPWIEEYPNSQLSPQVLNGFINGLIGLHEYCERFPDDRAAHALDSTCYASLSKTIGAYDRRDWTDYKRISMTVIQLSYLRYQLAELEQLYEMHGDPQWTRQMMIWSMMTYGKVDTLLKSYRVPSYQYAATVVDSVTGMGLASDSAFAQVMRPLPGVGPSVGGPASLALVRGQEYAFDLPAQVYYVQLSFSHARLGRALQVVVRDRAGAVLLAEQVWQGSVLAIRSLQPIGQVTVAVVGRPGRARQLRAVLVPDLDRQQLPMFGFYKVAGRHLLEGRRSYKLTCDLRNIVGATLFYRSETTDRRMNLAKWDKDVFVPLPKEHFVAPATGIYEFFIAFPVVMPGPAVVRFWVGE